MNKWLNNKERYIAVPAAKSIHTTSCLHQGAPHGTKVGHYPMMEMDLAEYVCNYHSLGVPIETFMIEEAKHIFCRPKPKKDPTEAHIAIHGDEDVSYHLSSVTIGWSSSWNVIASLIAGLV